MGVLDKLNHLNDICLFVKDFRGAVQFYTEKFGFELKRLQPDAEHANYAEFVFCGTGVTLWDKSGVCEVLAQAHLAGPGHHFMLPVKVPAPGDVDDIHAELTARGVRCIAPPTVYPFGSKAAYYHDHEENIWEVFAWMEGDGPGLL